MILSSAHQAETKHFSRPHFPSYPILRFTCDLALILIFNMVLLGGLEFVAAGYVLNELNKDSKKDTKKHRDSKDGKHRDSKDGKHRKKHRKHDHHYDSSDSSPSPHRMRPSRPPQQQSLRPPQSGPARPYSAPPPASRPMWQPPPFQGQPQHWQPNPIAYHPPQQAPVPYPPQQMPNRPPPQIPRPSFNAPAAHINPLYPPPGTYIDMKTGQIQHNLYPPGHEAARSQSDIGFSNVVMNVMDHQHVPSPQPGYSELDNETPGRYRRYDEKASAQSPPPPPYQEYR